MHSQSFGSKLFPFRPSQKLEEGRGKSSLSQNRAGFGELLRNVPPGCYGLLAALVIGSAAIYLAQMNFWRIQTEAHEADVLQITSKRLRGDIAPVVADLLILSQSNNFIDYLTQPSAQHREVLEQIFLKWGRFKPDYFEIRYLRADGFEDIRMDIVDEVPQLRDKAKLKDISKRYYFIGAIGLQRGQVFVSAFDLTSVNGKVLLPRHPTIRFATPVFDRAGVRSGVLVFDYEGRSLLEHLGVESAGSSGMVALLNSDGYWLKGPNPADEWGFMEEGTKDKSFRHDFPEEWAKISRAETGHFYSASGFYAFRSVYPLADAQRLYYKRGNTEPASPDTASPYHWFLVSVIPAAAIRAKEASIWWRLLPVDIAGLVILAWLSWNFARWKIARERSAAVLRMQAELLNLSQDAIVLRDVDQTIRDWNLGAERIYGWTRNEALGLNYMKLLKPASRTTWNEVVDRLLTEGQWSGEATAVNRAGETVVTLNRLVLHRDDSGSPSTILSINTDIRDQKKTEAELQAAKEAAESASRAKSEFLAVMSHEIRTPMNGVIGMTGLLLDTPLSPEQREYAETVRNSADALLTLINDILDYSKIEAGKMSIEVIPCDLRVACEEIAELMAGKAREKGLDVILRYSPDAPCRFVADPGRIRQVLLNLAGNAVKFTTQGHVYISVECEEQTPAAARMRFTVEDTGIGIPADKLGAIFDRFTQADTSTTRQYGGTGLGLAISKQLVELMGGHIGVESEPGKGAKFWMTLPLKRDCAPQEVRVLRADLSGVRVLGVDDNPTNLFVLREQLHSWGLRNEMSSSGDDALYLLRSAAAAGDPYHIVITDHQMPGMDGEELCRRIKMDAQLKESVVMLLTSLGARGDAARMKEAGLAAYLTKPTRQSQLYDALVTVWAGRESPGEASLVTRHSLAELRASGEVAKPPKVERAEKPKEMERVRARVLVVEDNPVNQKLAMRLLEKLSCRVDVAANGKEALDMIGLLPYDIVFMDCQMPVLDGYETTKEIRRQEGNGVHRLIIAMTAHAMQGDREQCLAAGMDDYISKPIYAPALSALLDRYLGTQAPGSRIVSAANPS